MQILDKIKDFFRFSSTQPVLPPEPEVPIAALNTPTTPESPKPQADETSRLPDWLLDENLLRDEGAIFGLSDASVEEKTHIIRAYFAQRTADIDQEIEHLNEKVNNLNNWITQKESTISQLEDKIIALQEKTIAASHHLPRTFVGLCLAIAMAVGNYFLIEEALKASFQNSTLISLGVFLAGMFNLFSKTSFLHENQDTQRQATWKRILEEFGMPLAASFFVFVYALPTKLPLQAFALWAFVFFLFLYAGKLLLSTLAKLQEDLSIWGEKRTLRHSQYSKVPEWQLLTEKHQEQIATYRQQKEDLLPTFIRLTAQRNRINARRDSLIRLFESEFNLARQVKEQKISYPPIAD